jgi:RNA polymerase-binding transcription factor DksA
MLVANIKSFIRIFMLSKEFIDQMKQKLLEEKKRLEEDLKGLSPHTEMGDDMDENAEEINVDEVNKDLIARMQNDLGKVGRALEKIEAGTYGTDDAGRPISEDRLKVMPWADKAI